MSHKIWIESLGCAKNQVDSEVMLGFLGSQGFHLAEEPDEADLIIVNTCGFIANAKEESVNTILEQVRGQMEEDGILAQLVKKEQHRIRRERGMALLFISHDLSVVEHISERVAVMYLGALCELASAATLFTSPHHPYTRALLSAIPRLGGTFRHTKLPGDVPTPIRLPAGCVFHTRCPHVRKRCRHEIPTLLTLPDETRVACHGVEENWIGD